ncbi:hypothetical protein EDEG_01363 [Edhazardia aedis USNM 41457]|uniref:Uncharacterized protein n=1 Tax=Edhazardia aedis (strain USNM 41457) TaxID=1003232 RepID=J9DA58_EDHAE|nr:hypothetical protein EDEG_01363 [Edhazardia aedis USNM 41457]|eukprot:EJW04399.1 hypothetical protein EDEG_01363 [Edhazardia aedis USNM 41457]
MGIIISKNGKARRNRRNRGGSHEDIKFEEIQFNVDDEPFLQEVDCLQKMFQREIYPHNESNIFVVAAEFHESSEKRAQDNDETKHNAQKTTFSNLETNIGSPRLVGNSKSHSNGAEIQKISLGSIEVLKRFENTSQSSVRSIETKHKNFIGKLITSSTCSALHAVLHLMHPTFFYFFLLIVVKITTNPNEIKARVVVCFVMFLVDVLITAYMLAIFYIDKHSIQKNLKKKKSWFLVRYFIFCFCCLIICFINIYAFYT